MALGSSIPAVFASSSQTRNWARGLAARSDSINGPEW